MEASERACDRGALEQRHHRLQGEGIVRLISNVPPIAEVSSSTARRTSVNQSRALVIDVKRGRPSALVTQEKTQSRRFGSSIHAVLSDQNGRRQSVLQQVSHLEQQCRGLP